MADINDYGMKVSRAGYDVKTCADHQLLFSSSFKMPLVVLSGTYKMDQDGHPNFSQTQDIVTHNLNFYPVSFIFTKSANSSLINLDTSWMVNNNPGLYITTTKIFYIANDANENRHYSYFIFNLDLEEDYTASIIDTSAVAQGATPQDYGIKVSKDGKDVLTVGLADLTSFSGLSLGGDAVRHQMIHKVGGATNLTQGSTATVAHGLGYAPMFLFYVRKDDGANYYWWCSTARYIVEGDPIRITIKISTYADATNIYYYNNTGDTLNLRYVILKDPLF